MSGLSNAYLEKMAFKLIGKKLFHGVFPADGLSKVPKKKNYCLIFNIDKASGPGIHFISIFVRSNKLFYFDSFGKDNIQKDINNFILRNNKKCIMFCKKIQHKNSNFCGFFALAFLLWMKKNRQSRNFYKMFNYKNLKINNSIVTNFLMKEIN
jgi:hypothetical protein